MYKKMMYKTRWNGVTQADCRGHLDEFQTREQLLARKFIFTVDEKKAVYSDQIYYLEG